MNEFAARGESADAAAAAFSLPARKRSVLRRGLLAAAIAAGLAAALASAPAHAMICDAAPGGTPAGPSNGDGASDGPASTFNSNLACGLNASAPNVTGGGTALGANAVADFNGTAVGVASSATNTQSTAIGAFSSATNIDSIAVGYHSNASGGSSFAAGASSSAAGNFGVAIGFQASAAQGYDVALGPNATASGGQSTALGYGATATFVNSTAIGTGATTTMANQIALGTATSIYQAPGLANSTKSQVGAVSYVTADANGTLGLSSVAPGGNAALSSAIGALGAAEMGLQQQVYDLQKSVRRSYEGSAIALSASGPTLAADKNFAVSAHWGEFRGQNAFGGAAQLRVSNAVVLDAGLGVGLQNGGVGGRAGATFAW
ncbi:MAG TPA: YadA-like family protein [Methylocystis sp.]|nr:YadA-like family protein [Methylocystis sp.]